MTKLFIENAAALSPLGANLDEIWAAVMAGKTVYGQVSLPGDRNFYAAETRPGTGAALMALQRLLGDVLAAVCFVLGTGLAGYALVGLMGGVVAILGAAALHIADARRG